MIEPRLVRCGSGVIFQLPTADFFLCPRWKGKAGSLSGVPFIRVLISCMGALSHELITSQSPTFRGLEFQIYRFGGIQSIQPGAPDL